ncbi:MAG: hypothetical protein ACOX9E_04345 [Lentisphaeria bacterium]
MTKRVMDDAHKTKLAQGRAKAKAIREKASELFTENGALLLSWKFWKNVPASEREAIRETIHKAVPAWS